MNYFKHSPLPKMAANRLRRESVQAPQRNKQPLNTRLETLDIMAVYAQRKNMGARWAGGDEQDRLEFVQEQKAKVGASLERVLNLSSKRMSSGHYQKLDAPFLVFDSFERARDIQEMHLAPEYIPWSQQQFNDHAHKCTPQLEKNFREALEKREAKVEQAEEYLKLEMEAMFGDVDAEDPEAVAELEKKMELAQEEIYELSGGRYDTIKVKHGVRKYIQKYSKKVEAPQTKLE